MRINKTVEKKITEITVVDILIAVCLLLASYQGKIAFFVLGLPIPNNGILAPTLPFVACSVLQAVGIANERKDVEICFGSLKYISFFSLFIIFCGYAFGSGFIESNRNGSFHDNIWYTVIVTVCLVVVTVSFITESVIYLLSKTKKRRNTL